MVVWVVTKTIDERNQLAQFFARRNQDGNYLIAVYSHRPNKEDLKKLLPDKNDRVINKLLNGGGRINTEYVWYNLEELVTGTNYEK